MTDLLLGLILAVNVLQLVTTSATAQRCARDTRLKFSQWRNAHER